MGFDVAAYRLKILSAAILMCELVPSAALAQGGGDEGSLPGVAGVVIDADGVLSLMMRADPGRQLTLERIAAAQAARDPAVAGKSPLRKVSLTRLEKAIEANLAANRKPTDEMRYLAGLTRVQYVFFYPESGDIVLAGPAEGWFEDLSGRVVSITSGQPILELQDLVVALRTYGPGLADAPVIGCSIDPTQEGLARMQDFLRSIGSKFSREITDADTQYIVDGLRTSLGMQQIRVLGVAPDTHFAQVMVEADYRMKLIGIGLERPPVKMKSYVDLVRPSQANRNALQRWYFTPNYECLRVSDDRLAMELVGEGVKLVGQNEVVGADGQRAASASTNGASDTFVKAFTKKYPQLAKKAPVYAQLRNLIDLAMVAAFIQHEDYYGQAGWTMGVFADEEKLAVHTYQAPVQVEPAINALRKGARLMTPIGGGVHIEAQMALDSKAVLSDDGTVKAARDETRLDHLHDGQWWWD